MFAPNDEVDQGTEHNREDAGRDTTDSVAPIEDVEQGSEVGPQRHDSIIGLQISIGSVDFTSIDPNLIINDPCNDFVKIQKFHSIFDFVVRFVV